MARRLGEMPCLNPRCNVPDMAVEETPAGTWQAKCHKCGCPTFGKAGTAWRRTMEQLTRRDDAGPATPPASSSSSPAAAPAAPTPAAPARKGSGLLIA